MGDVRLAMSLLDAAQGAILTAKSVRDDKTANMQVAMPVEQYLDLHRVNVAAIKKTIDDLTSALRLVRSMRNIDKLSPAEHAFEIEKRREAWAKVDAEIEAALAAMEEV